MSGGVLVGVEIIHLPQKCSMYKLGNWMSQMFKPNVSLCSVF